MKYTESHEWIDAKGKMGISHFAQRELGDIVFVELPKVGKVVKAGEEIAVLESTKAAADVYSPVGGVVTEINEVLKERPELINSAAENEGWICKLQMSDPHELDHLIERGAYTKLVGGDGVSLERP